MNGIISGLPILDYIRDPAPAPSLSASLAHLMLTRSPRHAWLSSARLNPAWEPDASAASERGTIAHALLLERDDSRVVVIDAKDYRTGAAKDARDLARAAGKLPILAADYADVRQMVDVARDTLADSELAGLLDGARIETTFAWQEDGVWCRCRPDIIDASGLILCDYKTTQGSAEPDAWSRGALLGSGYDLQAAFGLRAAAALLGPEDRRFVFLVQEVAPPYALSMVGLDPQFTIFAEQKFNAALAQWRTCLADDHWPAYPTRICWASPPEYAVYRWGERALLNSVEGTVDDL